MWRSSRDEPPSQRKRRRFLRFEGWFRMAAVQALRCKECHTSYGLEAGEVVRHLERAEAVLTHVPGLEPVARVAFLTTKRLHCSHAKPPFKSKKPPPLAL